MATEPQLEQFAEFRRTHDRAIRNALVATTTGLPCTAPVASSHRGEPMDDLMQVAQLGLVEGGRALRPVLPGRVRNLRDADCHRRAPAPLPDHTWPVRVPRRVKELYLELSANIEMLGHELCRPRGSTRSPEAMRSSVEEVLEAMEAGAAYRSTSLSPSSEGDDDADRDRGLGRRGSRRRAGRGPTRVCPCATSSVSCRNGSARSSISASSRGARNPRSPPRSG